MNKLEKIQNDIKAKVLELEIIEVGQVFYSKFYGIIKATKVTKHSEKVFTIYGYSEKDGLPRSNTYPSEIDLVGKPIDIFVVLKWMSTLGSISVTGSSKENHIRLYGANWDLSKPLEQQSDELITALYEELEIQG